MSESTCTLRFSLFAPKEKKVRFNIIATIVLPMLMCSNVYAANCSGKADDAAKQAYNWYNPVKQLSSKDGKIEFCYEIKVHRCGENINNMRATAKCDSKTGRYVPDNPSTMDDFYMWQSPKCYEIRSNC
jgi:hypothetical protein